MDRVLVVYGMRSLLYSFFVTVVLSLLLATTPFSLMHYEGVYVHAVEYYFAFEWTGIQNQPRG
jgi:hypothetical protein